MHLNTTTYTDENISERSHVSEPHANQGAAGCMRPLHAVPSQCASLASVPCHCGVGMCYKLEQGSGSSQARTPDPCRLGRSCCFRLILVTGFFILAGRYVKAAHCHVQFSAATGQWWWIRNAKRQRVRRGVGMYVSRNGGSQVWAAVTMYSALASGSGFCIRLSEQGRKCTIVYLFFFFCGGAAERQDWTGLGRIA